MLLQKGYKFRIEPTEKQLDILERTAGVVRFIWNNALALQNYRRERKLPLLSYEDLCRELTQARNDPDLDFLGKVHSKPQQQILKDLGKAFKRFFEKAKSGEVAKEIAQRKAAGKRIKRIPFYPRFKKKGQFDSFRFPAYQGNMALESRRLKLPALGWVRFRKSREIVGTIKNATLSKHRGHWFVCVQTEQEVSEPAHPSPQAVGIDMGVAKFAAMSSGEVIESVHHFKRLESKLGRAQGALSRKRKFSHNWKTHKATIARLHGQIADARNDFLHKVSTDISKNHAMVCMEDLKVRTMSASAKGTKTQPGKRVRQKAGLNKSILDQGWSEFRRQIDYKQKWRGGSLVLVPPHHTSQKCSCCGHIAEDNRRSQSEFVCVACSYRDDADINAAKNILAAGLAVSACGSNSVGSRKQEPGLAREGHPKAA